MYGRSNDLYFDDKIDNVMLFDRLLSEDEIQTLYNSGNLSYDQARNLTKDQRGCEYEYDYESRIVKITKNSRTKAEFAYDALGRRIRKIDSVAGQTTLYYHNYKWQVLCEYDGSGVNQRLFIYGNYIDEVLCIYNLSPVSLYLYVHDHLYSPAALVNLSGTVVERYEYDAYGKCYVLEPNFAPDPDGESDYGNPYLFTGRRVDILDSGSLKIQYNRNRYYDYYTGRWLTHDPLGVDIAPSGPEDLPLAVLQQLGILNLYEYANGKPTSVVDSVGLWGEDVHCLDTTFWAIQRGLCFAYEIGRWDVEVDGKNFRESPPGRTIEAQLLDMIGAGSTSSAMLYNTAYWHFPGADRGQPVVKDSQDARREIDRGLFRCNLEIFSKGLHQLQDSFSHQSGGQMPPWLHKVGHSRDSHGWYWEGVNDSTANPWVNRPRKVDDIRRIVCPTCDDQEMLTLLRQLTVLFSKEADNVNIFWGTYEETEEATKREMDRFRKKCKCIKQGPHAGECVICQGSVIPYLTMSSF